MDKKKVFLITSHYMGVLYIDELLRAGDEIVGVVAWPGTGGWYVPKEYDVRTKAFQHYLPLYEPEPRKLNSPEFLEVIRKTNPDFIVSGYYARIFNDELLSIPHDGCVNIHPTGLPRFRGLSPYFTHMLFGDDRNYITMHWLDPGIDTGDIIAQASIEILPDETGFECGHRLTEAGAAMFREYWQLVKAGKAPRMKQDESQASTFNFSWDMAEIDWTKNATQIYNLVRSITKPLNGAWTMIGGHKAHIWKVRVVSNDKEMMMNNPVPGQVIAFTGKGLFVQCGEGQLEIVDYTFDDNSEKTIYEALVPFPEKYRVLLG